MINFTWPLEFRGFISNLRRIQSGCFFQSSMARRAITDSQVGTKLSIQIPVVAFQWHGGNQPGVIPNKACARLRVYGPNEGNTVKHTCGWSFNTSPTGGISLVGICWHHNPEDGKYGRYFFVVFKFDRWKTRSSIASRQSLEIQEALEPALTVNSEAA